MTGIVDKPGITIKVEIDEQTARDAIEVLRLVADGEVFTAKERAAANKLYAEQTAESSAVQHQTFATLITEGIPLVKEWL